VIVKVLDRRRGVHDPLGAKLQGRYQRLEGDLITETVSKVTSEALRLKGEDYNYNW
jgi:hypothetical protein